MVNFGLGVRRKTSFRAQTAATEIVYKSRLTVRSRLLEVYIG